MSSRFVEAYYFKPSGNGNDGISPPNPDATYDGTFALAAAMTTMPVWVKDLDAFSVQFSTPAGSTLVGTLAIQASNDRGNREQTGQADVTMANWQSIAYVDMSTGAVVAASTPKAVATGAQSFILSEGGLLQCTWRWVRLGFVFTSGTGTPRITMQQKGWP